MEEGRIKMEPEPKSQFMVVKIPNPPPQVMSQTTGLGNYVTLSEIETEDQNMVCPEKRPIEETNLWTIPFDEGCSITKSGAGDVIISPKERLYPLSYGLQLEFTEAEKEALQSGLKNAEDIGIELFGVKGDVELIDDPIKGYFQIKKDHLRHYRNWVWNAIDWFEEIDKRDISKIDNKDIPKLNDNKVGDSTVPASFLAPYADFCQGASGWTYEDMRIFIPEDLSPAIPKRREVKPFKQTRHPSEVE